MDIKQMKPILVILVIIGIMGVAFAGTGKSITFKDDFENGTGKWDLTNPHRIRIIDSGQPEHGKVMALHSGGPAVYALIKNSHQWTNLKVEGDVLFPHLSNHYLGFIYNHKVTGHRTDFGSIFVLGPFGSVIEEYYRDYRKFLSQPPDKYTGSLLLVNPHRDSNASRLLYSEYWVPLKGKDMVNIGEWHHFKAEVAGAACHFYLDDMTTPKITYDYFESTNGRVGFKPRFAGSQAWVDNVTVTSIKELSYKGEIMPAGITYKPEKLLTKWQVIGPFPRRMKEIETDGYQPGKTYTFENEEYKWRTFETDGRGCVVSGRVCERFSLKRFAYFHTEITAPEKTKATLKFSNTIPLTVWVNKERVGEVPQQFSAWYDFIDNPKHEGNKLRVFLKAGKNETVLLVKGARYGGDGFYAAYHIKKKTPQKSPPGEEKK
ncbi:MAG: hypothetical protein GY757_25330 [bacterium]|nr:hypothetical protein [bacterium]